MIEKVGGIIVSVVVLLLFGMAIYLNYTHAAPEGAQRSLDTLVGSLGTMAMGIVYWWTGSTVSSMAKTAMIYNSTPTLPTPPQ